MATIQPPPPPQKTGNVQIDAYLRRIYEWAYLLWYYQTGAGIQDPAITGSTGGSSTVILGMDGEDGENGFTIVGPTGPQGLPGLTIPGMDGADGEDAFFAGVPTGIFDAYGSAAAAQAASQPLDADLTTWAGVTPGTGVATALAVNVGTAGAVVVNGGALGTPSSGTGTNITNVNAALLGGATFASPGAIGSGTAAAGSFTTVGASARITGAVDVWGGTFGAGVGLSATVAGLDAGSGYGLVNVAAGTFQIRSYAKDIEIYTNNGTLAVTISNAATPTVKISGLAGAGSRTVVADANGVLSAP